VDILSAVVIFRFVVSPRGGGGCPCARLVLPTPTIGCYRFECVQFKTYGPSLRAARRRIGIFGGYVVKHQWFNCETIHAREHPLSPPCPDPRRRADRRRGLFLRNLP